jgi:hypothetical protein
MIEGIYRLDVLKALTASLKGINPDDTGDIYDMRDSSDRDGRVIESVVRGRLDYNESDPLPMISIVETPTSPDQMDTPDEGTTAITRLPLLIQGFIKDDEVHPTDPAYPFMGAVQRQLTVERLRSSGGQFASGDNILGLGRHMDKLTIGRGIVRPPEAMVSSSAFFWLNVTLQFAERY